MKERIKNTFSIGKLRQFTLLLILILLVIVFSALSPFFWQRNNLMNIMRQISVNGICAVAMTMIIIMGDIDLSVGSSLAFLGVLGAMTYKTLSGSMGSFLLVTCTLLAVLLAGAAIGALSGLITAKGRIPAFVTTLALMEALRGIGYIITGGSPIAISSMDFKIFGSGWISNIVPIPVFVMAMIMILGAFLTKSTRLGRYIYAIGGNEQASRWSGINTTKVKILVFTIAGALYGLAAMVLAGRLGGGYPATGVGSEMDAIAATILGGTSLSGGRGSIGGTVIGVMIIGVINTGLTLLDVSTYWQQVLMGTIILVAVLLDTKSKNKE